MSALLRSRSRLLAPAEAGGPAIGGGTEKDPYLLANVLVEMTLRENDWNVVNIGPNTPIASFRKALAELRRGYCGSRVSYLADAEAFLAEYRELYEDAERAGVAVAVWPGAWSSRCAAGCATRPSATASPTWPAFAASCIHSGTLFSKEGSLAPAPRRRRIAP